MDQPNRLPRLAWLQRLKVYWRMIGPSRKPITCALYRTPVGLEVRAEHPAGDLLLVERVQTELAAETYAAAWQAMVKAQGHFTSLDIE